MNPNLLNYSNFINSGQYGIPNFDMGQGGPGSQFGGPKPSSNKKEAEVKYHKLWDELVD